MNQTFAPIATNNDVGIPMFFPHSSTAVYGFLWRRGLGIYYHYCHFFFYNLCFVFVKIIIVIFFLLIQFMFCICEELVLVDSTDLRCD